MPPDEKLHEAIQKAAKQNWIGSSLTLLAIDGITNDGV